MDKLELIVFDWDGTLMDSAARIVACMRAAFTDIGAEPPSPAEVREVIGLGLEEALLALWPEVDVAQRLQVIQRYRAHFLGPTVTPSPLFPGVDEVLNALHQQGLLLAIATGKSRAGLERALDESGLRSLFHATRCADETRSKPHPQMLMELLDELGQSPHQALVVGDTLYDIEMAQNASVAAVGVSYGVHEPQRLLAAGARVCLDRIDALPAWLEQHHWHLR